jgi:uncharacterized protein
MEAAFGERMLQMDLHILEKAREYVKEQLKFETSGHDWWHIFRVTEMAVRIAEHEGANPFVCEMAALFHDLADEKLVESPEKAMQAIADWCQQHTVDAASIDHILEIISTMSFRGGTGAPMRTLEGKAVQDADRLDALGAIGIARTFVYAGHKGHVMYDPDLIPRGEMTVEQYRTGPNTAINHFYEKLLKLKDRMNTDFAREIAESRHAFMEAYLRQFYAEWNADATLS